MIYIRIIKIKLDKIKLVPDKWNLTTLNYEYYINTSRDIYNVVRIKVSQGR